MNSLARKLWILGVCFLVFYAGTCVWFLAWHEYSLKASLLGLAKGAVPFAGTYMVAAAVIALLHYIEKRGREGGDKK